MNAQEYWRRRQIEREKKWHDLTTTELKKLAKYYRQSSAEIERDIAALFGKFARENKLPIEEARRLIRGEEFKTWRMTLQEYVRKSQVDPKILRELNTLAMRSRINRLEALHARTLMELANLAEKIQSTADEQFARAYLDNYYRNLYDFHTTTGLFTPPNAVDAKRVESVLQTAWSGKNYSSRIWTNTRKLSAELQRTMLNAIHRGSSIQKLSKDLATRMDVAYRNAERLVRTELNAVENRASADAMREAGFDSYQFMATLDRLTCARCGERDGEIFALKDMNQGENAPPLHPRCRCTIVATLDEPGKRGKSPHQRAARDDDGKRTRVLADMTYDSWKAVYIDKSKTFEQWQAEYDAKHKTNDIAKSKLPDRNYNNDLATTIGKKHYDAARDIVENTQHVKAAQVWCKFEERVEVVLLKSDEAYQRADRIYLNINGEAAGSTISTPYQVLFHEAGHLIDYMKGEFSMSGFKYFSLHYQNSALTKAIDNDIKALLAAKKKAIETTRLANMDTITKLINAEDWDELYTKKLITSDERLDLLYGTRAKKQKVIEQILKCKFSKNDVMSVLVDEMRNANTRLNRSDLSDIISGYTKNKFNLGAGHTAGYWKQMGDKGRATEAFAEFFSAAIAHPDSYVVLKKYLPTTEKIFTEILDELLKEV